MAIAVIVAVACCFASSCSKSKSAVETNTLASSPFEECLCMIPQLSYGTGASDVARNELILGKSAEAGIRYYRDTFSWQEIEKEKGKYVFTVYDRLVDASLERGIKFIGLLAFGNTLYSKEGANVLQFSSPDGSRRVVAAWSAARGREGRVRIAGRRGWTGRQFDMNGVETQLNNAGEIMIIDISESPVYIDEKDRAN